MAPIKSRIVVRTVRICTDKPFKSIKIWVKEVGESRVNKIIELLNSIFNKKEIILDDRNEFRVNKKEKILIKKYCDLKRTTTSDFFRTLAMKEIDSFIKQGRWLYVFRYNNNSQYKNKNVVLEHR